MVALKTRLPPTRIDPIDRILFGRAKPAPRPSPATQQQAEEQPIRCETAASDRYLQEVRAL